MRFACSPCCNLAACSVTHDSCMLCVTLAFVQLRLDETQAVLLDSLWWSYSTTRCVAAQIPTCADCTQQCGYWTRWVAAIVRLCCVGRCEAWHYKCTVLLASMFQLAATFNHCLAVAVVAVQFGDLSTEKPEDDRIKPDSNGSIIAVSYEARKYGVKR